MMRCHHLARRVAAASALVLALLLASPLSALAAERRVALIIGNSSYRSVARLDNPTRDAKAIAEMFKAAGFDSVSLQQDLTSLDLKRAIRAFMVDTKDSDVAVVYFAGHGVEVGGNNYILPIDAKLKTDFDVEDEGLTLERIIRAVEPSRRLRLVILDACRDNPFINTMQRTVSMRAITSGLGKVEPTVSDTLVAYAARAGSVAEDGSGEHSPFTASLLQHLPTPGLDIRVAFGRVRDDVLRATGGRQEPFVYGSLGGTTISLVPAPAQAESPRDRAAETRRDYEFAERVGTSAAWESFLQTHSKGFYADLARAQLSKAPAKSPGSATTLVAKVDLGRSETRQPTLEPPSPDMRAKADLRAKADERAKAEQQARLDPSLSVSPALAAPRESVRESVIIAPQDPCKADRATLTRLREQLVVADIVKFSRELKCEALRPQLTRLLESTSASGGLALAPAAPAAPVPVAAPVPAPATISAAAPTEADPAQRASSTASGCRTEMDALAQLRSNPTLDAVDRFAKTLTCAQLKPQVARLRESLLE